MMYLFTLRRVMTTRESRFAQRAEEERKLKLKKLSFDKTLRVNNEAAKITEEHLLHVETEYPLIMRLNTM